MAKSAQTPSVIASEWNQDVFLIRQILKHVHTGLPCRVEAVFPRAPGEEQANRAGIAGLVNVKLALEQYDNSEPPETIKGDTIYNVPYLRTQGGKAAVVVDPVVGDWGWIAFGERDISRWKLTQNVEIPPTKRMHSQSDGIYIPGILNPTPEVYVRVAENEIIVEGANKPITIRTTGPVTVNADTAEVNANSTTVNAPQNTVNGNVEVNGDIGVNGGLWVRDDSEIQGAVRMLSSMTVQGHSTQSGGAQIGGIEFNSHTHPGVQNGGGTTGAPI